MKDSDEQSNPSTGSVGEPLAWAVHTPDGFARVLAFARDDARLERKSQSERVIPLYRQPQPTLTDAEREAIWFFAAIDSNDPVLGSNAATLRALLERLK